MSNSSFRLQLRLDSLRRDSVGWTATFYGKPDIHGNAITVPVTSELADVLREGKQYVFELAATQEP